MSGYDIFAWIVLLILVASAIDTSNTIIGIEINQIDARYVAPGQEVETTFKFAPGQIYAGRVESILQAVATALSSVT
jgi:multidrug resistance efflux pump